MAKRPAAPEYYTDFSWAEEYIEERRTGKFRRLQVKFPLDTDRKTAGNIDYTSEEERRSWRGHFPMVGRENTKKSIKGSYNLKDTQFQFINKAPNTSNIPAGYIATPSGIEPLLEDPFTVGTQQGYPTDNPVDVNANFNNDCISGEFFITTNLPIDTQRYPYRYTTTGIIDNRMEWRISPEFENPTEPAVRYPKRGAFKLKK